MQPNTSDNIVPPNMQQLSSQFAMVAIMLFHPTYYQYYIALPGTAGLFLSTQVLDTQPYYI